MKRRPFLLLPDPRRAHRRLSPRQRECVRLVAQSFTRKEIGAHLGISSKTAEYHITRAAQVLNVCSGDIAAFTRFAIRTKLIKL